MKYFTKEWYDEMQVAGFLVFPETEAEWEDNEAWQKSEGHDPSEIKHRDLADKKDDLLKFLPASFHPYIHDGTINSKFPSPELRDMTAKWEADYEARVDALLDDYSRHYESIKGSLPEGAIQLTEKSLHDSVVKSIFRPADDTLIIYLDCSGGFHYFKDIKVTFTGVTDLAIPDGLTDAVWLYNEIYLKDDLFELHVLFDMPMLEMTIVSQDVQIEELE